MLTARMAAEGMQNPWASGGSIADEIHNGGTQVNQSCAEALSY
jgi:hypothetical protein